MCWCLAELCMEGSQIERHLRRSLKKEQKDKDKKSAAWKDRQQRQKKEGRDRQTK